MRQSFYSQNAWWLGNGLGLTFASSFGQTFFIALFAGFIRQTYGLSDGAWGGLYTLATFASAACLIQFGRLADTMPLVRLASVIILIYAAAALTMAFSNSILALAVAVFGLRFCGQGMMTHIAMTAMARWFRANRARAIAVAAMGFPLGEAVLPFLTVEAIAWVGWRTAWVMVAAFLLVAVLPTIFVLMRHGRTPRGEGGDETALGMGGRHWTRGEVLRHWSFWILLPGLMAPPFIGTCAFFHQVHIAEVRHYDLAIMALGFPLYAAVSVASSLAAGVVLDRVGVIKVLPVVLAPMALAIPILALPGGIWVWYLLLVGTGISQGVVVTLVGALWPTLYGTRWIGSIKAVATAAMVVATAVGPGVTGLLIDWGYPFPEQALWLSAYCFVMTILFALVAPRLARMQTPLSGEVRTEGAD